MPDMLVGTGLYILGSLITWALCFRYYERVRKRSKLTEERIEDMFQQIHDVTDEIDKKARIQAYKLVYFVHQTFMREMLSTLPPEEAEEVLEKDTT
jgi:hypothetical protein